MSFLQSSSAKLLEATDHFTDLSINKSKYLIYKNKKQKPKIKKDKVTIIENKRKK